MSLVINMLSLPNAIVLFVKANFNGLYSEEQNVVHFFLSFNF